MTFSVDGVSAVGGTSGGSSFTMTLSTSNTNDIIIVTVHSGKNGAGGGAPVVSSVTAPGLTFTKRKEVSWVSTNSFSFDVYYAVAAAALSSKVITVTLSGTADFATGSCYGLSGCDTSTIWDSNGSLPASATAGTVNISTTATNTIGIGCCFDYVNATVGSGYTTIDGTSSTSVSFFVNSAVHSEYQVFSSVQTNKAVNFTGTNASVAIWADALLPASPPPNADVAMTLFAPTLAVSMGNSSLDATTVAMTLFALRMQLIVGSNIQNVQNDQQPFVYDTGAMYWWGWGI